MEANLDLCAVLKSVLQQLNENYPELTSVYEIGKSVEGRPLTVLAIGRFPNTHSPGIPEFKYVANIHGNEVSSPLANFMLHVQQWFEDRYR